MDSETGVGESARTFYLNPTYRSKDLLVHWGHLRRSNQTGTAAGSMISGSTTFDQVSNRVGFRYNLTGALAAGLMFDRNSVEGGGNDYQRDAFSIPVIYTAGANTFSLVYGQALDYEANGAKQAETGAQMLTLSYERTLSKRTFLNASIAMVKNDDNGRYNFWTRGFSSPATGGTDNRMVYVGMKHRF